MLRGGGSRQQRGSGQAALDSGAGVGEIVQDRAAVLEAGGGDGQQPFGEAGAALDWVP